MYPIVVEEHGGVLLQRVELPTCPNPWILFFFFFYLQQEKRSSDRIETNDGFRWKIRRQTTTTTTKEANLWSNDRFLFSFFLHFPGRLKKRERERERERLLQAGELRIRNRDREKEEERRRICLLCWASEIGEQKKETMVGKRVRKVGGGGSEAPRLGRGIRATETTERTESYGLPPNL